MPQLRRVTAKQAQEERVAWLLRANVHLAAGALAVVGLVLLLSSGGRHTLFRQPDALLGLRNQTMLVILGFLHLGLGVWLLVTRDLMAQGLALLWWGANCTVYLVGMAWLKVATPLPVVALVAWTIGARARTLNVCWKLLIAYLVLGSIAHLILQWRRVKRMRSEAFMRHWKQVREKAAPPQK